MKYRFHYETDSLRGVAIFCMMIAVPLYFFISCNLGKKEFVDLQFDRETSYNVKSADVTMLISDSGITRIRLVAKEWYIFDEASEPYNYYPEKIHGELLDTLFHVEASFDADTAYYYSKKKLWKFIDNVKMVNLAGEIFETSLLFWDEGEEKFYSDQFIRITKGEFINTGTGFESNQSLTEYRIFNSKAEIPIEDNAPADSTANENSPRM
jgi:LPS export ABC transporter protein LptC